MLLSYNEPPPPWGTASYSCRWCTVPTELQCVQRQVQVHQWPTGPGAMGPQHPCDIANHPELCKVVTPCRIGKWTEGLRTHPDQQFATYTSQGLANGFTIGFDRAIACCKFGHCVANLSSTQDHPEVVSGESGGNGVKKSVTSHPRSSAPGLGTFSVIMEHHNALGSLLCGILRAREFTIPSEETFDPVSHRTFNDVTVDSHTSPSIMRISLKVSKCDPFRRGVDIILGRTYTNLCPVMAILHYLAIKGNADEPLFKFHDGCPLTKPKLVSAFREALSAAYYDWSQYLGHSFRIGAASTAASQGLEDSTIKTLGRWHASNAYLRYIQIPAGELVSYSRHLVK